MAIWYDVSDLFYWNGQPLTGIQRTTVSLLREMRDSDRTLRLFRFRPEDSSFVAVEWAGLPPWLDQHIPGQTARRADAAPAEPTATQPKRQRPLERLERRLPPDLQPAFAEFRTGFTVLRRALKLKLRSRFGRRAPPAGAEPARPPVTPAVRASAPFAAGDVVCSLGASWFPAVYPPIHYLRELKRAVGFRYVCLIYDIIPTLHPEWMTGSETTHLTRWLHQQLAAADIVLTISEFSKQEILRYCGEVGLAPGRIEVIRLGDNVVADRLHGQTPPLPRFVPDRPFVIVVSVIDVRKNHDGLYRTWKLLARRLGADCPKILFIGRPHLLVDDLLHQIAHDREINGLIHVLSDIPDGELLWYYRNCLFTMYPSVYEGWGVPVGESLALGRYCIASNAASVPEIGGDLVDYFDPYDTPGCLDLVLRAVNDPGYVAQREAEIRARYRPTRWSEVAAQVRGVIAADEADITRRAAAGALP